MRRYLLIVKCMAIAVLFGMSAFPSSAYSQTSIVVSPENPSEIDSLEITINAVSTTTPVWIYSTSFEVTEGLIKIIGDVDCGPYYAIEYYSFTVLVPPVAENTYAIQYWTNENCHLGSNPILSSEIVVSPEPIAAERSTWGTIKALW